MSNVKTPCECQVHRGGTATVIGKHAFTLGSRDAVSFADEEWRWLCSCGSRGRWQAQSDNASYHDWLRHCGVPHNYTGEGAAK